MLSRYSAQQQEAGTRPPSFFGGGDTGGRNTVYNCGHWDHNLLHWYRNCQRQFFNLFKRLWIVSSVLKNLYVILNLFKPQPQHIGKCVFQDPQKASP